jgi:hypothetical protein
MCLVCKHSGTCASVCICKCVYACMYVCIANIYYQHICVIYTYMYIYIYIYIYIYQNIYIYTYVYIYIYECMYVCIFSGFGRAPNCTTRKLKLNKEKQITGDRGDRFTREIGGKYYQSGGGREGMYVCLCVYVVCVRVFTHGLCGSCTYFARYLCIILLPQHTPAAQECETLHMHIHTYMHTGAGKVFRRSYEPQAGV